MILGTFLIVTRFIQTRRRRNNCVKEFQGDDIIKAHSSDPRVQRPISGNNFIRWIGKRTVEFKALLVLGLTENTSHLFFLCTIEYVILCNNGEVSVSVDT